MQPEANQPNQNQSYSMSQLLSFAVSGVSETPTRLAVTTRQFHLTVDEPPSLGGIDAGANPVEYLLAAYAGCLNVVLNLVAQERNLKLDNLRLEVSGTLDPARLFGQPDAPRAGFQDIQVVLQTDSNVSDAVLEDLLQATKARCPINDNLANPTPIGYAIRRPTVAELSA